MGVKRQLPFVALLAVACLGAALSGCGTQKEREGWHLARGQRYLSENNLVKARLEFRVALQIVPTDATARYENGVVEERLGNYVLATGFYQAAIESDPDHVASRVALAKINLLGGFPQLAAETMKPAFTRHPEDPRVLAMRAACESALK